MKKQTCSDCVFYIVSDQLTQGTCVRFPPQVQFIPQQTAAGVQMAQASSQPVVQQKQNACGEFKTKLAPIVN